MANDSEKIIVIGAGAAGLMAAKTLAEKGYSVLILEARDRTGGRILTTTPPGFHGPVEAGAEFIHGKAKLTHKLLKEAGIKTVKVSGEMWRSTEGSLHQQEDFIEGWDVVMKKLSELKEDIPVRHFFEVNFPEEKYADLKNSLIQYVEGYDAADAERASSFAFRDELSGEADDQLRIDGGYGKMIDYLTEQCKRAGCQLQMSTVVESIEWQEGMVNIKTNSSTHSASKAIITIPLSLLNAEMGTPGYINFSPALTKKRDAARKMGFGGVIKILLEFKKAFWNEALPSKSKNRSLGFVFSDQPIPTWWTQLPDNRAHLTGWLAGPKSEKLKNESDEEILGRSIESLSGIFNTSEENIRAELKAYQVAAWISEPFALGAYSYTTIYTIEARKILTAPEAGTLFFAGEALYDGSEMGTVEAALVSGLKTAEAVFSLKSRV